MIDTPASTHTPSGPPAFGRRLFGVHLPIWTPFAVLGVVVLCYALLWFVVRGEAVKIVEAEGERLRQDGYQAEWADMRTSGFPFRLTLSLDDPTVTAPLAEGGWSWSSETVTLHTMPHNFMDVMLQPAGEHTVTLPDGQVLKAVSDKPLARAASDRKGLKSAQVVVGETRLAAEGQSRPLLSFAGVAAYIARAPQDDTRHRAYAIIDAPIWRGAGGDAPEGGRFDAILTRSDVLSAMGLTPEGLMTWGANDGEAKINDVRLVWSDAKIAASGALSVEPNGALEGSLEIKADNPKAAVAHLRRLGVIEGEDVERLVGLMAANGVDEMTVPIRFRNAQTFVMGMPVGPAPRAF